MPAVACLQTQHFARMLQELHAEAPDAPMLLTKDNLERALMARLMEPPDPYPQTPFTYLCAPPGIMQSHDLAIRVEC